jgi:hypothetical protein
MRKTFCDRCGEQCVNTIVHLYGTVEHQTNQGEQVGGDDIKQVELCNRCFKLVQELVSLTVRPQEMAMAAPPVRG